MKNHQQLYYNHYYLMTTNGESVECTRWECFAPADFIDPAYAALFYEALSAGVEMYPFRALVSPAGIDLGPMLPVRPQHL